MLIAFNKPYGVISQFTPDGSPNRTLAEFGFPKNVYPIGRLDADSEGLLLLSDEPELNERLLHPRHAHQREYWAQVERTPTPAALEKLAHGVIVQGRNTLPCRAWILEPQPEVVSEIAVPDPRSRGRESAQFFDDEDQRRLTSAATLKLPPRDPPIRFRKNVPTCWVALELTEGKNRQVRRMTAAIGHPTLRLIRVRMGGLALGKLPVGEWQILKSKKRTLVEAE